MAKKFHRIRNRLRKYFTFFIVLGKGLGLIYFKRSFLVVSGFVESTKRKQPCRQDGSPIPWMNYNAITFLEQRLTKDLSMFEYGCGNSTLFFSELVGNIVSVECSKEWFELIAQRAPDNVTVLLYKGDPNTSDEYSNIINAQGKKFDIVIVDAEDRNGCMLNACDALSDTGVLILDDSHRKEYQTGIDVTLAKGFKRLDFAGLKAGRISLYRTTIFYRAENCIDI